MEQIKIDLHVHSHASDGTDTPSELIAKASELGLTALALTDHDTISGVEEFLAAAAGTGVEAVPGVEVSTCVSGREIHIVGLFVNHTDPHLTSFLEKIRSDRNERNDSMLRKLNSLGYKISLEELQEKAGGESIGRPHIASVLIEKGYFKDNAEAFERCLRRGRPGYSRRELPSPEESIKRIHHAGGIAIWAHPLYRNKYTRSHVRNILKKLVPDGLDGIECYYPGFTPHQTRVIIELAEADDLLLSGGSDYHGSILPHIHMGTGDGTLAIPGECFLKLKEFVTRS
ncbi:MAG: PHP domain-containing protein [Victivallales bacterium]|nr:PHP domain-containing protein [Victivallales bacterium]